MNSIVVHYKELALKGKNRPWFIRMLVRNLKGALAGLHVARGAIANGPDRARARARARRPTRCASACGACSASPTFRTRTAARTTSPRWPPRSSPISAIATPASFRVSATRSDKRLPFTSPQVEREVGGLIKEAKGWRVDLERPALTVHIEMLPGRRVLLLRQGAGRRRHAERIGRAGRVPAVGRHRLAGRRLPADAPRLLGAADSFSQLSDPVARLAGEGARDRGAADAAPAALAAAARAVRRAAAAGRARGSAGDARRHLPAADAADRRAAGAQGGTRARW